MASQYSTRVRNAVASAVTDTIAAASSSAAARVALITGAVPASCAAADAGVEVGSCAIAAGNMAAAAGGAQALAVALSGITTQDGTIGHYRVYAGDGQCDEQGTVTLTGGGGDCELAASSLTVVAGQPIAISLRSLVAGGA